jgi:hypothetical protein
LVVSVCCHVAELLDDVVLQARGELVVGVPVQRYSASQDLVEVEDLAAHDQSAIVGFSSKKQLSTTQITPF